MTKKSNIYFDSKPDPLESKVRFVCGLVFGFLIGCCLGLKFKIQSIEVFIVFLSAISVIFGLLAVRYGDRFWLNVFRLFKLL